jgi:penicillin-binding protein 1B
VPQLDPENIQTCESPLTPQRKDLKWLFIAVGAVLIALDIVAATAYYRLTKRVDQQLRSGPFQNTLSYFAAPETVSVGDATSAADLAAALKRAGRSFTADDRAVSVQSPAPAELQFSGGAVASIIDRTNGRRVTQYELPPQLIANMSEEGRAKRIPVRYADVPPMLIHAVVSAEDKRFFKHPGIDPLRMAKALYVDLREHRKQQGASTITMQLARNLWLSRDKSWKRKIAEALITLHLEQVLTKQQILEDYCNTVFLGGHGSFSINGFGEAARAYFNKDLHKLTLSDAATLAGLIQRPSYFNPFRYPERALERRNVVLMLMRENKYINASEYDQATAEPLGLRPGTSDLSETQYFMDLASDEASKKLEETYLSGLGNVYTTLDLRLQRAAEQAIADGMQLVDKELAARHNRELPRGQRPQVALIALDPHTGAVKALCGGREYALSQLDRVLSKRPPGSAFKPFVYTAALNTALTGGNQIFTPASTVEDSPTTFEYGRQTYTPSNFKHEFRGTVTLREALAHSLNVATVKVGQMVGFDNVVALAHSAGMNEDIKPTPAVALGAYQVTPFEIARAYTIFANDGMRVQPTFVSDIRDQGGTLLYKHSVKPQRVLDPRVAFLMVDMLQEVMRSGTAAGVRARGFKLPAAGKTGTSHDGWFAGFTSELLCVVWVGFDDYTELGLEGARSALPIWTEFMMQAARYKQYGDVKAFEPPQGVVKVAIDPETGNLAGPYCPEGVASYFINGTQPGSECAPQEVEVIPTSDGGVLERSTPVRVPPVNSLEPERSISIEVPIHPPTPAQTPPP